MSRNNNNPKPEMSEWFGSNIILGGGGALGQAARSRDLTNMREYHETRTPNEKAAFSKSVSDRAQKAGLTLKNANNQQVEEIVIDATKEFVNSKNLKVVTNKKK